MKGGSLYIVMLLFVQCIGMAIALLGSNDLKVASLPVVSPKVVTRPLSNTYYQNSCPNLEGIIQQKMQALIKKDTSLIASIIRLHFHDCIIRVSSLSFSFSQVFIFEHKSKFIIVYKFKFAYKFVQFKTYIYF